MTTLPRSAASIKDVAERAGVSTTTVSRVLSDPEAVRPVLRDRVLQAIADLGYRPNLAARRLRQQRASLIGLIVSDIRNPFFTDVSRAVEDAAYRRGLRLILCNTDEDPAKERSYLELMADEQASGVILSPSLDLAARLTRESWPFPITLVDRAPDGPSRPGAAPHDAVLLDNTGAARRLTEHLLDQGARRIAVLSGSRSGTSRERVAACEAVLQARGLSPQTVLRQAPTAEDGRTAITALLSQGPRPDAILATNGLLLLGAWQALQAAGLRVPDEVMLAGFDNNDWTALPSPGVTVIAQPTYEIGRNAAELLLQRIDEPQRPARRVVLDGEMIVRGSSVRQG